MKYTTENIIQLIKARYCYFYYLRKGIAYYMIEDDEETYMFPVPLDDIGDATLKMSDKAIFFMRYIRKALTEKTFVLK